MYSNKQSFENQYRTSGDYMLSGGGQQLESMDQFLSEVSRIRNDIDAINGNIDEIQRLEVANLRDYSNRLNNQNLEMVTSATTQMLQQARLAVRGLSDRIRTLGSTTEATIRRQHRDSLAKRLQDCAYRYKTVQEQMKKETRDVLERQYRIVHPEATSRDIQAAIDEGGSVFSRELIAAGAAQQRRVLEEVKERHQQIERIAAQVSELLSLMEEMGSLIDSQQLTLNVIDEDVKHADIYIRESIPILGDSIVKARDTRKTKWIITGIASALAFIILLIILWKVGVFEPKAKQ
ncbi:t-SNARE [Cladochytrium replicatum]|nr:t-SNARE [Cladochytrium replicatum]